MSIVRVWALDFAFLRGEATASALSLMVGPVTRQTISAGDFETIKIR